MEARIGRTFESEWPEIARWLRGAMARRGVPFGALEDVVQETGCRLWKMWDRVDETRSTRALAIAIASNYAMDEFHRRRTPEPVEDVPDVPAHYDVEEAGLASLELARIKRALKDMSQSHQRVLLAEIGDAEAPEASPAALKMLRLRARRKLHLILNSTSAGFVGISFRFKHLAWRTQNVLRRSTTGIEVPGGAVATLAAAAIALSNQAFLPQSADAHGLQSLPAQTKLVDEARIADRDGWIHLKRASSAAASETRRARQRGSSGHSESVVIDSGDGPVSAGAGITWTPVNEGDEQLDPPTCSVDPSREDEVTVRCTAEAGDRQYHVDLTVGVGP